MKDIPYLKPFLLRDLAIVNRSKCLALVETSSYAHDVHLAWAVNTVYKCCDYSFAICDRLQENRPLADFRKISVLGVNRLDFYRRVQRSSYRAQNRFIRRVTALKRETEHFVCT